MRIFTGALKSLLLIVFIACLGIAVGAAPLGTLQNSMLSVPATDVSARALPGSNVLLSAVALQSEQGGHVSLAKSLQWMRRYTDVAGRRSSAYASVVRSDGSLVVTGPSEDQSFEDNIITICYATDGTPLWTNRFDGVGHGVDRSYYAAVRTNGDIWVVGQSMRYATNDTLTDVVTIHYASNGVPAWTNIYSSFVTNGTFPTGLSLDAAGNAYVLQSGAYWQDFGGTTVEEAITKYDLAGNLVWTKHFTSGWDESLRFVENMGMDRSGQLFVAGYSESLFSNVLIKYDANGLPLYTNSISFPAATSVRFITPDADGNMIVTSESYAASNTPTAIMKRLKDGTVQWTNSIAGPNYNGGSVPQSAIDPEGNIFLIAGSVGAEPGQYQILKVNSDGVPLWTNLNANFGLTGSMISGSAVNSGGNLFLAGYAPGTNGYRDGILLEFSGSGQLVWSNRLDGGFNLDDVPFNLAVDATGGLFITGQSDHTSGHYEMWSAKFIDRLVYTPPQDFVGMDTIHYTLTDASGTNYSASVNVAVSAGSFRLQSLPTVGGAMLQVSGFPGTNRVVIEASSDFNGWQPLATNAPVNGSLQWLDAAAAGFSSRFYRAFQQQ